MELGPIIDALVGPAGLAIAAVLAVIALWRAHTKADTNRDAALERLTAALPETATALRALTEVVKDARK